MNVLIVDDQEDITSGLKEGINWDALGIDEVYTARSAAGARLIIRNHPIDILFTDIEMPVEDGISLVRWVREYDERICCIFLTSHAEFSYAKAAIDLGSFDYLLQPVRFTDIEEKVKKAREHLEREKRYRESDAREKELLENVQKLEASISQLSARALEDTNLAAGSADADDPEKRIEQAILYIRTHISSDLSRGEVAEAIHLSEEYFSRMFHQCTGWTFKDYVIKEKMNVAMHLLASTRLPVSLIGSKVGYQNFSHFSQAFKRITGKTPQEYRKSHTE